MANTKGTTNMDVSRPARGIMKLATPIFISAGAALSVNLVDAYFVSRLGNNALAAIGYAFPLVFLGTSLAMGFSNGLRAPVAAALGRKDEHEIKCLATYGLLLTALIFLVVGAVGFVFQERIGRALGVEPGLMTLFTEYMTPLWLGFVLLGLQVGIGGVFTGMGKATIAGVLMLIGAVLNAVLNPALIFGIGPFPALGISGSAWATTSAWTVATLLGLILLIRQRLLVTASWRTIRVTWRRVAAVGGPFTFTALILPISLNVITSWVSGYGPEAVAAWGVAARVGTLIRIGSVSLGAGAQVLSGYAWGAGQWDRVRDVTRASRWLNYGWGLLACLVLMPAARPISHVMTDSAATAAILAMYLWLASLSYGFLGSTIAVACVYSAINRPLYTVLIYLANGAVFLLPMTYAGAALWGLNGIFAAFTVSAVCADLFTLVLLRRTGLAGARAVAETARPDPAAIRRRAALAGSGR
jgi:putative MATE family efflux protein